MDPKNLILFVNSSKSQAGANLLCAVVVAEATKHPRNVTLSWEEDAYDPLSKLILTGSHEFTIPKGEKCVVFELDTNRKNFGLIEITATLEDDLSSDSQQIEILAQKRRRVDTIPIVISLVATDANIGVSTRPLPAARLDTVWPISTPVRITMDGDWGIADVLVKKPSVSDAVFQVDLQTGRETLLRNKHITFIKDPEDIPTRVSKGDFTFRLSPRNLPTGRYSVHLNVTLHARDINDDYFGSDSIVVLFDNP
ncbi:MAG: hypothetical protein JWL77_3464 [Chthonomonadaceae bacterium]|nr:hypothetical protein [Chthonomonadaceae bacterium]